MKFSLVIGTLGRVDSLETMLNSLLLQKYTNFEVIIVDQNSDNLLLEVIQQFIGKIKIIHLRCMPGLSRARNLGIKFSTGDVIAFPDDDCWYDAGVLEDANNFFQSNPGFDGLTGVCIDANGQHSAGKFDESFGLIAFNNVWRRAISTTIFLRKKCVIDVEGFDEQLGLGSSTRWQSGEETDLILRVIKSGSSLIYNPLFKIRHPQVDLTNKLAIRKRAVSYSSGFIYVHIKHKYSLRIIFSAIFRPLMGSIYYFGILKFNKATLSFWTFYGRMFEFLRLKFSV